MWFTGIYGPARDTSAQFGGTARHHEEAVKAGKLTCIGCHQGIAYAPPKKFVRPPGEKLVADPDACLADLGAKAATKN